MPNTESSCKVNYPTNFSLLQTQSVNNPIINGLFISLTLNYGLSIHSHKNFPRRRTNFIARPTCFRSNKLLKGLDVSRISGLIRFPYNSDRSFRCSLDLETAKAFPTSLLLLQEVETLFLRQAFCGNSTI